MARPAEELARKAKEAQAKAVAAASASNPVAVPPAVKPPQPEKDSPKDASVVKDVPDHPTPTPEKPAKPGKTPDDDGKPEPPKGKKLDGSGAVKTGGADEKPEDEEAADRKRKKDREDAIAAINARHQNDIEMERIREEAAIRRENRAEARRYGPLISGKTTMSYTSVGGKVSSVITTSTGWRNPNPRSGEGVFFDPNGSGQFSGSRGSGESGNGLPGFTGITDNSNGKSITGWEVQTSYPPKYVPVYSDGSKGPPVTKDDFGNNDNPRGTGRLGINAFSTEGRQSFIDGRMGGAKPGDANYDRTLAMAQSSWDAYSRDSISSFQSVGRALADAASKRGIPGRVEGASRDPAVVDASRPQRDGRIGIGPRDEQGRSALSKDWGTGPTRDRNLFGGRR